MDFKESKKIVDHWKKSYKECPYSYTNVLLPLTKNYLPVKKGNKKLSNLIEFIRKNAKIDNMTITKMNEKIYIRMSTSNFNRVLNYKNLIRK
jgi:hypothetical protein